MYWKVLIWKKTLDVTTSGEHKFTLEKRWDELGVAMDALQVGSSGSTWDLHPLPLYSLAAALLRYF